MLWIEATRVCQVWDGVGSRYSRGRRPQSIDFTLDPLFSRPHPTSRFNPCDSLPKSLPLSLRLPSHSHRFNFTSTANQHHRHHHHRPTKSIQRSSTKCSHFWVDCCLECGNLRRNNCDESETKKTKLYKKRERPTSLWLRGSLYQLGYE